MFCAHSTSPTCSLNLCSVAGKYLRTPASCLSSLCVSSALLAHLVHLLEVAQPKYKYTKNSCSQTGRKQFRSTGLHPVRLLSLMGSKGGILKMTNEEGFSDLVKITLEKMTENNTNKCFWKV